MFSESSRPSEDDSFPPIDPNRIQVFHNKVLMNGDSAVVCKAQFLNLPCAAKYIHPKLVETSSWQVEIFKKGCQILRNCRHPNIVSFLGVHSDNRLKQPILLMELMDQSLKEFLDHSRNNLPFYLQLDICSDVAQGLEYLHAREIIHGNLTATNILVKRGRAKIGGVMPLQINTPDGELSLCPGAPESMPRRSFSCADYDEAIDCFSFGVLGIHIATRELPNPHSHVHESTEIERYENSLQKVEKHHPLHPLIIKCLNDVDHLRPSAKKLCEELATMIKSSAYRNSQSTAEQMSTELVGLQVEYVRDKLHEQTEENQKLQREVKYQLNELQKLQAELDTANDKHLRKQKALEEARKENEDFKCKQAELIAANKMHQKQQKELQDIVDSLYEKLKKTAHELSETEKEKEQEKSKNKVMYAKIVEMKGESGNNSEEPDLATNVV